MIRLLLALLVYGSHRDTVSIVTFGAQPGKLATVGIQAAIDACNRQGGGAVLVPAGTWLTGPLVLKSGVDLHLAKGAVLQFTRDFDAYPLVRGNWEGREAVRNQSPISATGADHISITGDGVIDGGGDAWRPLKQSKAPADVWARQIRTGVLSPGGKTWWPSASALKGSETKDPGVWHEGASVQDYADIKDFLRPNLIYLHGCTHVLLEGVTFRNSPAWCIHPLLCRDLTVRKIFAQNPPYAQNGDGIDIESCDTVLVEDSRFDVGDDGICIKSGRDEEGRRRGAPTQHAVIRRCTVYHAHGGFVIGSEMSGGVRDMEVYDCAFLGTDVGLRFKSARGRGGVVENIHVHDIYMKDIAGEAILFDMYYMAQDPVPKPGETRTEPAVAVKPVDEGTPVFRHFFLDHIVCNGASKAIFIRGLPEMPVQDVRMEHLSLTTTTGMDCRYATGVLLRDVQLYPKTGPVIRTTGSRDITFDSLRFVGAPLLIGDGVVFLHTDTTGVQHVVVDPSGKGDFTTIQAALNSLPDDAGHERVIDIRPGIYREKLSLTQSHVALVGEDPATTVITQAIARDIWRCDHKDDWGVATVNASGSDVDLVNLTIENSYGFDHTQDTVIACALDTAGTHASGGAARAPGSSGAAAPAAPGHRKVTRTGHQMALRTFATTRLRARNCVFKSFGGDTVSPWNVQDGLFYFKDCTMEGGVDFYCPRGWAYAEHCHFIALEGPASIWHDGSANPDAKTVLRDCSFEGYPGFHLGRYHRDAQFYLVNCSFSTDLANEPITLIKTNNRLQWGQRIYYYNCHRMGGDYPWFADNLAQNAPLPGDIRSGWVFGARWDPESIEF
ncbi:pectinesterase family protein [Dinghuibacter silviterrae]|uniref:Pectinesterase n=1 Tax=Dinghuibacter silviterrae TaxID=1539049 RepID=A0A4R8DHK4_9BACT|nr:pectinesterase family protein [Dinghuibacter silviterrae]TDW96430.1 pectinesterase [Dinghuibacter silviterrae]